MKITHIVLHNCIRASKISWLLMERGHQVKMVTERVLSVHGWKDYDMTCLIHTGQLEGNDLPDAYNLMRTVKALEPITDIFHFHNEPDWPVEAIRKVTDKPLVYDIHDMVSIRTGEPEPYENKALELCDGVLVPSRLYKENIQSRVKKPVYEILNSVPEKLYPKIRRVPHRRGIVYEGGLKGMPKELSDQFEFRDWASVFRELSKMNIEVWAYPAASREEDLSNYHQSGAILMNSLPYDQLLKNLASHEAGLVGSPFPSKAFNGALPNKMFEYISAGVPVIAYNAPSAAEFLHATGFGEGIDDLKQVPDVLEQFRKEKTAEYVWRMRGNWTMERQIGKVETLYKKILGVPLHE